MQKRPARALRLLHTSDVHLEADTFGAGASGEQARRRMRQSFGEVIAIANRHAADLLLIVGDLFDSSRIDSEALRFAFAQIESARMPVVMIPGNHDAHDERSIYAGLPAGAKPRNLRLILEPEGKLLDFPELGARVWGRALVEHSPDFRPLAGLPAPTADRWNIALAHGFFVEDSESLRSSPITADDIATSGYDYIALGHIHVFNDVSHGSTRALYCGAPAPIHVNDEPGFVALVTCAPDAAVEIERLPVKPQAPAP